MLRRIRAFILGIREFRCDTTTSFENYADLETYDLGREIAHRVTLRHYDHNWKA